MLFDIHEGEQTIVGITGRKFKVTVEPYVSPTNDRFPQSLTRNDLYPGKAVRIHHTMPDWPGQAFSTVVIIKSFETDTDGREWVWVYEQRKYGYGTPLKAVRRSLADMGVVSSFYGWNRANYTVSV